MSDEPVEAPYEAIAEEPDALPVEDDSPAEAAPEAPDASVDDEPETQVGDGEHVAADSAEAEVAARMHDELDAAAPDIPAADFSLPAGTELGFALTGVPIAEEPEAGASQADEQPQAGRDAMAELPASVELGYAFTAVMTARFRPDSRPAPAEAEPEVRQADTAPQTVEPDEVLPEEAAPQAEGLDPVTLAEADAADMPAASDAEGPETAVTEIVERAVAVAGQDTPPPHPSDTPAQSAGAVGEVEAEKHDTPEPEVQPVEDDLLDGDDPLMAGAGAEDAEDAFSPRDLAADLPPDSETKADVKSDDGSWGYLASLAAGAVVTAFGAVMTWGDWGRMWEARSLTGDAWALIAGVFLMLAAAWSLGSVWLERLKNNRRNTADAG